MSSHVVSDSSCMPRAHVLAHKRLATEGQRLTKLSLERDGVWVDPSSLDVVDNEGANATAKALNGAAASSTARNPSAISGKPPTTIAQWQAYIQGPLLSVWRSGVFRVEICILEGYPLRAPKVKFRDPIYHPNVNPKTGEICSRVLTDGWSPSFKLEQVLHWLRSVLADPNFSSTDITKVEHRKASNSNTDDISALLREQESLRQGQLPSKLYHYTTAEAAKTIQSTKILAASKGGARGPGVYTTCLHPTNRTKHQIQQNNSCRGADYVIELDTAALQAEGHLVGKCNDGYTEKDGDHYLITKGEGSMQTVQGNSRSYAQHNPVPRPSGKAGRSAQVAAQRIAPPAQPERITVVQGVQIEGISMDIFLRPGMNSEISTFEDACTCVYNNDAHKAFCCPGNGEYKRLVRRTIVEFGQWLVAGECSVMRNMGDPQGIENSENVNQHKLQTIGGFELPEILAFNGDDDSLQGSLRAYRDELFDLEADLTVTCVCYSGLLRAEIARELIRGNDNANMSKTSGKGSLTSAKRLIDETRDVPGNSAMRVPKRQKRLGASRNMQGGRSNPSNGAQSVVPMSAGGNPGRTVQKLPDISASSEAKGRSKVTSADVLGASNSCVPAAVQAVIIGNDTSSGITSSASVVPAEQDKTKTQDDAELEEALRLSAEAAQMQAKDRHNMIAYSSNSEDPDLERAIQMSLAAASVASPQEEDDDQLRLAIEMSMRENRQGVLGSASSASTPKDPTMIATPRSDFVQPNSADSADGGNNDVVIELCSSPEIE